MTQKPTYEELDAKLHHLEAELERGREVEQTLRKSNEQLLSVLDSLDAVVYVADMTTYEVLFVNRYAENLFGSVVGRKCWQSLQTDQSGPCPFCTNKEDTG